jgi:hypothetical protein
MAEEIRFHNGGETEQENVVWAVYVAPGGASGRKTRTTCMRRENRERDK